MKALVTVLNFYRKFVSPFVPCVCRFYPSCSAYARQAVERYGTGRGVLLALRRLARCHPFSPGGYDPLK